MPIDEISAAAAGTWTLAGRTVNRLGFGAMRLTTNADGTASDRDRAIGVLRRAVDLGVNHIDTAAFYFSGPRSANELINRALAPYPDDLLIVTKVGPGRDPCGEWLPLARPDQLRGQVEENLRQLGRDHLDVVNLRQHGLASVAEHVGALAGLRDKGMIKNIGLSNVRTEHLAQAQAIAPVVCVQNRYGIGFSERSAELLRVCREQGIAFVPFFSITGDGRDDGGVADDPAVRAVAGTHGVTPAQVRVAWTLRQGPHVLAIPGTGNPDHLRENVAAAALHLSADDLAALG
jgi:aryl-alcohol dehydrogenase-like predicted oxidoreductase